MHFENVSFFGINIGFVKVDDFIFDTDVVDNFSVMIREAENGNDHSMFKVGTIYEYGGVLKSDFGPIEIIKNIPTAIELYKKAGEMGSALAFYRLGDINFYGIGVVQNQHLAIEYFISAAEKGEHNSMFFLGTIEYKTGDKDKACIMIKRAADYGNPEAAFNTATMLYTGDHLWPKDVEQARYYINVALMNDSENQDYNNFKKLLKDQM